MAEWQTHKTQNLAEVTSCGFKSHYPQSKKNSIIKDFNDWDIYYFTIFITMVSQEVNVSFFIQKALTEDSISSASA